MSERFQKRYVNERLSPTGFADAGDKRERSRFQEETIASKPYKNYCP